MVASKRRVAFRSHTAASASVGRLRWIRRLRHRSCRSRNAVPDWRRIHLPKTKSILNASHRFSSSSSPATRLSASRSPTAWLLIASVALTVPDDYDYVRLRSRHTLLYLSRPTLGHGSPPPPSSCSNLASSPNPRPGQVSSLGNDDGPQSGSMSGLSPSVPDTYSTATGMPSRLLAYAYGVAIAHECHRDRTTQRILSEPNMEPLPARTRSARTSEWRR